MLKKILLISTGGTIASRRSDHGLTPVMGSEELLSYVPRVKQYCMVDTCELFNLDSTNITPDHWLQIAGAIQQHYDNYDGFVIAHGTDTMAYTAAALSYLIQDSPKPIVLTGGQKPIDMESTDARRNLQDAFLYASYDYAAGVQVVFSGNVILGTRAKKTHSKDYNAFSSMNYPCLASIRDGKIFPFINQAKDKQVTFYNRLSRRVGVIKLTPGASPDLLGYYLKKCEAVIIESFGTGGIPQGEGLDYHRVIDRYYNAGKIMIMTTQVLNDGSDVSVYKVGADIKEEYHLLEAYDMTTEAALAKLMWILPQANTRQQIEQMFYTPIANDLLYQVK